MRERRVKILWLSDQVFLGDFLAWLAAGASRWTLEGVPVGCRVEGVTHSWERRAVGVMLSHPSFDEVPDGQYAPDLGHYWTVAPAAASDPPESEPPPDCVAAFFGRE